MADTTLLNYLSQKTHLNPTDLENISQNYQIKTYSKGDYLLQKGTHCQYVYFVEKGLLRQYTTDEKGKEHTLYFAPETWWIADRESMYFNQPSSYDIQALEDTQVAVLTYDFIKGFEESSESFFQFNHTQLHRHIQVLEQRITMLLSATAEERYLHFIKTYPDVLLRVPQTMVASYLGITPESLSRVRKELMSK
ncbi:Crp/Fnr family transcriptional regulator [Riemerella columbina]|uniref:Crp/Fnr family transcriptional regulator n=1 Tax=Riemerella columbina TaxID=103810 RepID=UPI000367C4DC|nr:Crp/Fnr family transcriptional regulator [Riemerella columbina]